MLKCYRCEIEARNGEEVLWLAIVGLCLVCYRFETFPITTA
jgi:hypothetical protein